jgi:hypothetical protein
MAFPIKLGAAPILRLELSGVGKLDLYSTHYTVTMNTTLYRYLDGAGLYIYGDYI